jgi:hypothetical protein
MYATSPLCCILVVVATATIALAADDRGDSPDSSHMPPAALSCGPSALLIYTTLCGKPATDEALMAIHCGDSGLSLLELSRLSESLGVSSEVRHLLPADYLRLPTPAIVQVKTHHRLSHYCVAYEASPSGLLVMDGGNPSGFRISAGGVADFMTGYVLVPSSVVQASSPLVKWSVPGLAIIACLMLATAVGRVPRPKRPPLGAH